MGPVPLRLIAPGGPASARVTAGLEAVISRSVRTGLRGVWLRGPLPQSGAVLAPNHHGWWDGYVLREVALTFGAEFKVLMTGRQLSNFPFLRRVGALRTDELRAARRAVEAGAWLVVFPEGALQPPGPLGPLQPGAAWLARSAGVPLVPVALRVVLRGQQQPEAYLRFGQPVSGPQLAETLAAELSILDAELATCDPEEPLPGYLRISGRAGSQNERLAGLGQWLARLTGDQ